MASLKTQDEWRKMASLKVLKKPLFCS